MQYSNYAAVVNNVNVYNDAVLAAAQQFALAIVQRNDNYDTASFVAAIRDSIDYFANDAKQVCWQHDAMLNAVELYNDECVDYALYGVVIAMITRSAAYEKAFC